jgi:hypothetical protein
MHVIYAAIDGTGDDNDAVYEAAMRNSFVNRLWNRYGRHSPNAFYHRGPTLLGMETGPLGVAAAAFVHERRIIDGERKVVLAGYSRGGAAVITAAQILAVRGIFVDLMVLFDAVDRSITAQAGTIPPNVRKVLHARRSAWALSRVYFGNCGTSHVPIVTDYTETFFLATHGGVGGCPWWNQPERPASASLGDRIYEDRLPTGVTYQQDLDGSDDTWRWMLRNIREAGA